MALEKQDELFDLSTKVNFGIRAMPRYRESPFVNKLVVQTKKKKLTVSRNSSIIQANTGEVQGVTEISQIIETDAEQHIKLYTKDLAIWFDLNKAAMRVFGALLATVQSSALGKDLVFFDHKTEAVIQFKISHRSFYRGIEELIFKGFIARHTSFGWYFYNPTFFFNGDRIRFVKEYKLDPQGKLFPVELEQSRIGRPLSSAG